MSVIERGRVKTVSSDPRLCYQDIQDQIAAYHKWIAGTNGSATIAGRRLSYLDYSHTHTFVLSNFI